MARFFTHRAWAAAVVWAGLAGHAAAQVTYFDKPPSPTDLAQALRAAKPAPAAGTPSTQGLGGRGIEWKAGTAPAADAARELPPVEGSGGAAPVAMAPAATAAAPAAAPTAASAGPAVAVPVQFQSGSSAVSASSMPYLDAIGMALAQDPSLRLVIEGHTDAQGDPRVNLMLSWERAFSVFKVLVQRHRIDPGRLQPMGRGAQDPMQGTMPTDGVNRRVQFRALG